MIEKLPPRERQLFDALYRCGEATASELEAMIANPPSNSAVRAMLRRLEAKGFVIHREVEQKFVYAPAMPARKLTHSALRQVIDTFFNGSPARAASALLGMSRGIGADELDELEAAIAKAREEQRK